MKHMTKEDRTAFIDANFKDITKHKEQDSTRTTEIYDLSAIPFASCVLYVLHTPRSRLTYRTCA